MSNEEMIAVRGISKTFGTHKVVQDVTFAVHQGRVTGFVGPNGAGKSTTMRMMVGLVTPEQGDIRFAGVPFRQLPHPARTVGVVLDARSMHPGRTARQHLRALAALGRLPLARTEVVLREVGLAAAADRRVGGYSLGMRQRLALAGALLGEPSILLLDEPANGLDPEGIRWLRRFLRRFADQGGTVFVSSHLIAELEAVADDLVVVAAGKVIAAASVAEIVGKSARTIVVSTPQTSELLRVLQSAGHLVDVVDGKVHVRDVTRASVSSLAFTHRIQVEELTEKGDSLEDILLALTANPAEFVAA